MAEGRLPGVTRPEAVTIYLDGEALQAVPGEMVAFALWAQGRRQLRRSARVLEGRGMLCAMGICYECLVEYGGRAQRACMLPVVAGMELRSWPQEERQ